jgi:hypothetical protein
MRNFLLRQPLGSGVGSSVGSGGAIFADGENVGLSVDGALVRRSVLGKLAGALVGFIVEGPLSGTATGGTGGNSVTGLRVGVSVIIGAAGVPLTSFEGFGVGLMPEDEGDCDMSGLLVLGAHVGVDMSLPPVVV